MNDVTTIDTAATRPGGAPARPKIPELHLRRRALAEAAGVFIGLSLLLVAGTTGLWHSAMYTVDTEYRDHLAALATAIAQQIDPALHERLRDPRQMDGPEYSQAIAPLRRLVRAIPELKYAYTVVRDGANIRFVLDAAEPGDHDGDGVDDRSAIWELYEKPDPVLLQALGSAAKPGFAAATSQAYTDKWGTFFSGYAPIRDAQGRQVGAVGVDVDSSVYLARRAEARQRSFLGIVPTLFATLFLSFVFFFMRLKALTAAHYISAARVQAERALARLGEYRAAMDHHDILAVTDPAGVITDVNDLFCKISGYSREDLIGSTLRTISCGCHDDAFWAGLWRTISRGDIWQGEVCNRTRTGQTYWVAQTIVPTRDAGGRVVDFVAISTDITERRQSEEVLARERQSLANVIEATGTATWEWDLQTGEISTNERWATMLGYRSGEMTPIRFVTWKGLVHPEDVTRVGEAMEACLGQTDVTYECDFRMRHKQGHWVWITARGNVIERAPDGSPRRMAGTQQDVTNRMTVELALKESERKFRGLFELSPVGIALNNLDTGQFLEINDALIAPTGYTREELLSMTYWDITPPVYGEQEQEQLELLQTTGHYGPYEKEYLRKDGTRYPVLLSGMCLTDASGRRVIWSIVQDISQRKAMERELSTAARSDKLTGLANRTAFAERLHRAIERARQHPEQHFAVLFLDSDRFKLINDSLGHEAGDTLLRQIAARLRHALRVSDTSGEDASGSLVARFGGDEFVMLVTDLHAPGDAPRIAERLLNALAAPYHVNGREVHSSASIGIVTSDQGLDSADAIIRNADVAMYEAKQSGRACAVVFNESMHTRLARHLTIESALRKALGTPQLYLVYQPIVDLENGRLVSAEALLRWNHPQIGNISPTEFIPIAEDSGLIVPLGEWVLREACRQFSEWRRTAPDSAPATISVNVARAQLALGDRLLEKVREVLTETRIPSGALQLEVTEREVMRDPESSRRLMRDLRGLGVRLAMDDFGTGTSSLACLREYPFDTIKIDRTFVNDLEGNRDVLAVLHATVALVENLGMTSVAEGVEDASQVAILQSVGCRYAQGYYFAKPVPPEQLLTALERQTAARTSS